MRRPAGLRAARAVALLATGLLSACGTDGPATDGVTVGEARALDEAAEMLDEQRLPKDALPPTKAGETPAAQPSETPSAAPAG